MKRFLQNTRWAVLWGLFLVLLHILPGSVFPHLPTYLDLLEPDKLVHVAMFGIFTFLMIRGFRKEGNPGIMLKHPVLTAIFFTLLFGIVMELTQNYLIPNRIGDVYDLIADLVGSLAGWGLWRLYQRLRK